MQSNRDVVAAWEHLENPLAPLSSSQLQFIARLEAMTLPKYEVRNMIDYDEPFNLSPTASLNSVSSLCSNLISNKAVEQDERKSKGLDITDLNQVICSWCYESMPPTWLSTSPFFGRSTSWYKSVYLKCFQFNEWFSRLESDLITAHLDSRYE